MTLVSPDQVQTSDSVVPEPINTPINQIAAVINGNLDNDNIASGAGIDPTKISGGTTGMFSAWATWSPTLTNATLGNGTVTAKYIQIGKTVLYSFTFVLGSTSSISGTFGFSLPATSVAYPTVHDILGSGTMNDTSGSSYPIFAKYATTTTVSIRYIDDAAGGVVYAGLNGSAPVTVATGDSISVSGAYQAA